MFTSPLLQTLMVQVWYPTTVCTNSRAQKEIIAEVLIIIIIIIITVIMYYTVS